jgi:hypothetical protein
MLRAATGAWLVVGFPLGRLRQAEVYYILQHDLDVAVLLDT